MKLTNVIKSAVPSVILGVLALGLTSTPAVATTSNTTFAVSASVVATCSITANALGFGAYTGVLNTAATTISVYCTNTTAYNVGLDAGLSGGTVTTRAMKSGPNKLNYSLTSDSAGLVNWGNTAGSWVGGTGNGTAQTINVYGQIPAAQTLIIGTYADTITATVNY